jgi:signal transduction histidine kinase
LHPDDIQALVDRMDEEVNQINSDLTKLVWYMRGGLSRSEAMMTSYNERKIISDLIKENMEVTKKSGLPHF